MNPKQELRELAINLEGMADGIELTGQRGTPIALRLRKSGEWLHRLSGNICGQGYIGCNGGEKCGSDHK
jgi:hypothetical protein